MPASGSNCPATWDKDENYRLVKLNPMEEPLPFTVGVFVLLVIQDRATIKVLIADAASDLSTVPKVLGLYVKDSQNMPTHMAYREYRSQPETGRRPSAVQDGFDQLKKIHVDPLIAAWNEVFRIRKIYGIAQQ